MAQQLVTTCDRCAAVIMNPTHIVVKMFRSNDQREVLTKDDLCDDCVAKFESFMAPKK